MKRGMPTKKNTLPKRRTDIQQKDLSDGCMLLDPDMSIAYALNVTASLVSSHCDGKHSINGIAKILGETSRQPLNEITEDVSQTITSFYEHGLVFFENPMKV